MSVISPANLNSRGELREPVAGDQQSDHAHFDGLLQGFEGAGSVLTIACASSSSIQLSVVLTGPDRMPMPSGPQASAVACSTASARSGDKIMGSADLSAISHLWSSNCEQSSGHGFSQLNLVGISPLSGVAADGWPINPAWGGRLQAKSVY
jgi:hypothetical protein